MPRGRKKYWEAIVSFVIPNMLPLVLNFFTYFIVIYTSPYTYLPACLSQSFYGIWRYCSQGKTVKWGTYERQKFFNWFQHVIRGAYLSIWVNFVYIILYADLCFSHCICAIVGVQSLEDVDERPCRSDGGEIISLFLTVASLVWGKQVSLIWNSVEVQKFYST